MIRYIGGEFEIHGLTFKTEAEFVAFVEKVRWAIRMAHPNLRMDSDVAFEVTETSGDFEESVPEDLKVAKIWRAAFTQALEMIPSVCRCDSLEHKGTHTDVCPKAIRATLDEMGEHPPAPAEPA